MDINERTRLILEINEMLGYYINNDCKSGGNGLFEYFSEIIKEIVLNRVDDILRRYNTHETTEKYRKSIGLRLWSGCLSADQNNCPGNPRWIKYTQDASRKFSGH